MLGRMQVFKTLIVSQLLYVTSVVRMPEKYIKKVNELIGKVKWKSKRSKLKVLSCIWIELMEV